MEVQDSHSFWIQEGIIMRGNNMCNFAPSSKLCIIWKLNLFRFDLELGENYVKLLPYIG